MARAFPLKIGNSCKRVDKAATIKAAWSRVTESASESPAEPETIIAGVTQPTIIATTCCSARGMAFPSAGRPSSLNSSESIVYTSVMI